MTKEENSNSQDSGREEDLRKLALDLDFSPDWARKPASPDYSSYKPREERPARRHRKRSKAAKDGRSGRGSERRAKPAARKDSGKSAPRRRENRSRQNRGQPRQAERVQIPPIHMKFLPIRETLGALAKKIKAGHRAYPLLQIARLYLNKPESCSVRIEVDREARDLQLSQCKICGMAAIREDSVYEHMATEHLESFMEKQELGQTPSGNFPCVSQCGMSGILLGPPNHHSYDAKIREVHSERYPRMSLSKYKSRITTLHDEESVEKWKEEYARQPVYKPEGNEVEPMLKAHAKKYFRENIAPAHLHHTRKAILPLQLALKSNDRPLAVALRKAWDRERRFPSSLLVALRGAFRNMGLDIFKAGSRNKETFVTPVPPSPIALAYVEENVKTVILYLGEHPGVTRRELKTEMLPEAESGSKQVKELFSRLNWLIERGHIIEFFDETLTVPGKTKH